MKTKSIFTFGFVLLGITSLYAQTTKDGVIIDRIYPEVPDSMKVYVIQVPPKFPGDLKKYYADNIKYPDSARKNNIQGTVYLTFIIEKDGSITHISILRSPNTMLSNEAIRVISTMPKWSPGMQDGKPVKVQFNLPVHFKLQ